MSVVYEPGSSSVCVRDRLILSWKAYIQRVFPDMALFLGDSCSCNIAKAEPRGVGSWTIQINLCRPEWIAWLHFWISNWLKWMRNQTNNLSHRREANPLNFRTPSFNAPLVKSTSKPTLVQVSAAPLVPLPSIPSSPSSDAPLLISPREILPAPVLQGYIPKKSDSGDRRRDNLGDSMEVIDLRRSLRTGKFIVNITTNTAEVTKEPATNPTEAWINSCGDEQSLTASVDEAGTVILDYTAEPLTNREIPVLLGWAFLVVIEFGIIIGGLMLLPLPHTGYAWVMATAWSFVMAFITFLVAGELWLLWFPHMKRGSIWHWIPCFVWQALLMIGNGVWIGILFIPFSSLPASLPYQPCTLLFILGLTKEERNDPEVRTRLKSYWNAMTMMLGFYICSGLYIIAFGYTYPYPVAQIVVNLWFACMKYILKRVLYRYIHTAGGFLASNGAIMFMDTMHHSFTALSFLNRASYITIVLNVVVEALFILRMDLACSGEYQVAKQKMISMVNVSKLDNFMDKIMYPSIKLTMKHRIMVQTANLVSTAFSSMVTIVGFILVVLISRGTGNRTYYPYSNEAMAGLAFGKLVTPIQGAFTVVVGTHLCLVVLAGISLAVIKRINPHLSVLAALRFHKDNHLFSLATCICAIAFPITFVAYHQRYVSFFFPELYICDLEGLTGETDFLYEVMHTSDKRSL
ncbi:hypothetical protein PROFUN_02345 [Planoprotostelium fungivorum]|uniref:Uncharacterized protein n=1 Tax=Planoprotostelium fungivorum TaxID=1890364 RepID=A0A2P6NYN0_9EUKA|nr:hypothetical protein PROFUN_02345 [Planoprotostelium fungivorum]